MHTIWKGNVAFGLINISVRMHAATEDKDIKLKSLHKDCMTPIKYVKMSPDCSDDAVTEADIIKAYEYAKDRYVVVTDAELQRLKNEYEVKTVEVIDFIRLEEIDPVYYNNSYYLSPEDGQERAYSLLRKALAETNKVGIAKISMRSRQQMAVIRTYKNALVLETIHYPDEIRAVENIPNLTAATVDDRELAAAKVLIEQLTTPFEPAKYTDEYRTALMELIAEKIEKETPIAEPEAVTPKQPNNVVSLMDILQASIEKTKPVKIPTDEGKAEKPKRRAQKKKDKEKATV